MPLSPNSFSVLIVMDDVYAQKALTEYARHAGYRSLGVAETRKAAAIIAQNPTHLVVVDLGKKAGREFIEAIKKHKPDLLALGLVDDVLEVDAQAEDVIDDDANAVTAVEHVLEVRGFEVTGFQDPGEGIEYITQNPPDVIILDVQMAKTTGFEVMQTIHKDPNCAEIPVLIFTSDPSRDNVQHAIQGGAKGFLAKPFDPKDLTEKVRSLL